MPRKKTAEKVSTTGMSHEEYFKKFGRKKPGPAPGAKKVAKAKKGPKKVVAKATKAVKRKKGPKKKPADEIRKVISRVTKSPDLGKPPRLKKDGTPWGKRGPAKAKTEDQAKVKTKDLGPVPTSKSLTLGQLTQQVLDLKDQDLKTLYKLISDKLEGDTSDFDETAWAAVQNLTGGSEGIPRYEAIGAVRKDLETEQEIEKQSDPKKAEEAEAADDDDEEFPGEEDAEEEANGEGSDEGGEDGDEDDVAAEDVEGTEGADEAPAAPSQPSGFPS